MGREVEIIISDSKNYMSSFGSASFIIERFIQSGGVAEEFVRLKGTDPRQEVHVS